MTYDDVLQSMLKEKVIPKEEEIAYAAYKVKDPNGLTLLNCQKMGEALYLAHDCEVPISECVLAVLSRTGYDKNLNKPHTIIAFDAPKERADTLCKLLDKIPMGDNGGRLFENVTQRIIYNR